MKTLSLSEDHHARACRGAPDGRHAIDPQTVRAETEIWDGKLAVYDVCRHCNTCTTAVVELGSFIWDKVG